MKKYEVLEVLQNGLTTSFSKGEANVFLGLITLRRDEEKCFSTQFVSDGGYGKFSSELKRIIGAAPFLKAVEVYDKVPQIVAVGNSDGTDWILVLESGSCIYTKDRPEKFLEKYAELL